MQGRNRFTSIEANQIRKLLRDKVKAGRTEQKTIRGKIRGLGFFITDFTGSKDGFSVADFETLISNGSIVITEEDKSDQENISPLPEGSQKDEAYVINLCDEVLGVPAQRQHRFDFLLGDAGTSLPVDAYYPKLNLVIEYRERQHTEAVGFFDKPGRMTVSGVHRGEQRRLYDERRREVLPAHGIKLEEFSYSDFAHAPNKRLTRDREKDLEIVRNTLSKFVQR